MSEILAQPPPASVEAIARRSRPGVMLALRWLGTVVDWLIFFGFLIVPDWLLGNERYQQTIWVWLGPIVLYYPVLEGFWGRTPGKLIAGTIVVDAAGRPPGIWKAVLRTLARLFEVNPFLAGGIPAGIVMLNSVTRRRVGDMWAKTYVVRNKDLHALQNQSV
ncbi:MAG: RDD family protein [Steroidobacteraceae bacterium]|jgi:uncharacterized RDD family membrane protein YckC